MMMDEAISDGLKAVGVEYPGKGDIANFRRALAEAGYCVVPKEPTEAMLDAARDWSYAKYSKSIGNDAAVGCWAAMLAASQA